MTFRIKTRGAGGLIVAEYECSLHGRFEVTAQRDANGDAPATEPCPVLLWCYAHDVLGCSDCLPRSVCNEPSSWTISAPKTKVLSVVPTAAVRGGDMKERPPWMLDTRPLAEGMKHSEWKAKQRELTRARRHQQLIDKGVISKKVIV